MKNTMLLLAMMVAALLMAGCSEPTSEGNEAEWQSPKKRQASPEQEKTVVVKEAAVEVNEGVSKKEEKELQQRLAELEEKVDDKAKQKIDNKEASQPDQEVQSTEEQALEAAQDYFAAAAAGNYNYTYDALSSASRSQLTEEEWVDANTALGSDAGIYRIDSINVVDDSTVVVYLTITSPDGSTSERITQFILENGSWKHALTQEEYALFAGALDSATASASASTSASATAPSSPSASPNPSPNRNNNASRRDAPGNARPSGGGGGLCPEGSHWVGIDGPGDGDSDGCAGE
jgi:hypothetical protein